MRFVKITHISPSASISWINLDLVACMFRDTLGQTVVEFLSETQMTHCRETPEELFAQTFPALPGIES